VSLGEAKLTWASLSGKPDWGAARRGTGEPETVCRTGGTARDARLPGSAGRARRHRLRRPRWVVARVVAWVPPG
jgi:hypothetical protein